MPQILVTRRDGQQEAIDIRPGTSLMQTITDAGVSDLLALCGGVCSCATCHVYVDGDSAQSLPPMSEDESNLLDFSSQRRANSRLSCQIFLGPEHDGLIATIAPEN